jgi:hypothetical protein
MQDFRKGEGIEKLRSGLYERPDPSIPPEPQLPPTPPPRPEVASSWQQPPEPVAPAVRVGAKQYRKKILIISVLFFFITLLASSAYFFFGKSTISGENIQVTLSGPFTIGAGDTMPLQVTVANYNEVDIESALLVISYPSGTKKSDGSLEDLFSDRIPINSLQAGQSLNIPVRPIVFGEENQEFAITAMIEYRVRGSNSIFEKQVAPLRYKISSTPVTLTVSNPSRIASGQEGDITLTLTSNAKTPISNLLVRAEYPTGFQFVESSPAPISSNNVWLIESLEPESTVVIQLRGKVTGQERDELVTRFSMGVARSNDFTQLATQFGEASASFVVENPFLAVDFDMDDRDNVRIAEFGEVVNGSLVITNETNEPIYDVKVVLDVAGNAISRPAVRNTSGFYDENTNTITWDSGTQSRLKQMDPGDDVSLSFSIPVRDRVVTSPTITLATNVEARRVTSANVSERLVSTVNGQIKVLTEADLLSEVAHVAGPVPPKVGQTTDYKVTLRAQAGTSDLTEVRVATALPAYVTVKEVVGNDASFNFNPNDRSVVWNVGTVSGGSSKTISFVVSYTPPSAHVGDKQLLVSEQRMTATDAFTERSIQRNQRELTTELSTELGFPEGNGKVVQ